MIRWLKRKKKHVEPLAYVTCCTGKLCLIVGGYAVAVEATQCWDGTLFDVAEPMGNSQFGGYTWNKAALEKVADKINATERSGGEKARH